MIYNDTYDPYSKSRLKQFKVTILDKNKISINTYKCRRKNIKDKKYELEVECKGRYVKLEFLENFGGDYFVIGQMKFFIDITYSLQ